jgi:hypothetical protein
MHHRLLLFILSAALLSGCKIVTKYETLCEAAKADDIGDVKKHIRKGAPVEMQREGFTPFYWAIFHRDTAMAQLLLKHHANVNVVTPNLQTPLQVSLQGECQDFNTARWLLRNGAVITDTSTLLSGDDPEFLKFCIANGYLRPSCNLLVAAASDFPNALGLLLDGGADVSCTNDSGATSLGRWARYGFMMSFHSKAPDRCFRLLMDHGAQVSEVDRHGRTPLHWLCMSPLPDRRTTDSLLARGADINARDSLGYTPLHYLAREGFKPDVEYLLSRGADPTIRGIDGRTPYIVALAQNRNDWYVETILERALHRHH